LTWAKKDKITQKREKVGRWPRNHGGPVISGRRKEGRREKSRYARKKTKKKNTYSAHFVRKIEVKERGQSRLSCNRRLTKECLDRGGAQKEEQQRKLGEGMEVSSRAYNKKEEGGSGKK